MRRDAAFISSVLFTIALACLIPASLANAKAGGHEAQLRLGPAWGEIARMYHQLGVSSLAMILIGLVVTWRGYVDKVRWTWIVMFVIVWGWAFPIMVWPLVGRPAGVSLSQLMTSAIKEAGPARDAVELVVIFALMVIALLLPVKSFLRQSKAQQIAR